MSILPGRTDEQRLAGAPFAVRFGGVDRSLRPLPRRKSREWQALLTSKILGFSGVTLGAAAGLSALSATSLEELIGAFALKAPEDLAEIVFTYAQLSDESITRDWFEENVADEEIAEALLLMVEVAYPFYLRENLRNAGMSFGRWLMSELGISQKPRSTNGASDGTLSKTGPTSDSG